MVSNVVKTAEVKFTINVNSFHFYFQGEPFTQEEMEEMLSAAVDPDKGIVFYKDFVAMMVVEDP